MFGVSRGQGFANIKNKVTRQPFSRGRGFVPNGLMQENGREGKNGNKSIYAENQKETITQGKRTARILHHVLCSLNGDLVRTQYYLYKKPTQRQSKVMTI